MIGLWKLEFEQRRMSDGTSRTITNNTAYIFYSDTGHMCYVSQDRSMPKWAARTPTPQEALTTINGLGAYCATVEPHDSEGYVLHRVEIVRIPNDIGVARKRWVTFDGPDRMTLRVDSPELSPDLLEWTLTWQRVKK